MTQTALELERTLARISADRLERIEASLESVQAAIRQMAEENRKAAEINRKAAEENERFHTAVCGAIESLAESASKHDRAITRLEKQWQAYLNTLHPRQ